jgi:hypothetical protein
MLIRDLGSYTANAGVYNPIQVPEIRPHARNYRTPKSTFLHLAAIYS